MRPAWCGARPDAPTPPHRTCTAGRMRVSSSSLIMATTSSSSSWMAVSDAASVAASVKSGAPDA